ncbi:MAG: lipase family protein [Candidatus Nanopelagicales bacterium]|nr:lipase family protein [Candidatus Nanopelagicales bacterium]
MRAFKIIGIFILAVILCGAVTVGAVLWSQSASTERAQAELEPFYLPPDPLPAGKPGDILRSEPMPNIALNNASAHRVLYLSEDVHGKPVAVSGMIFVPNGKPAKGDRQVIAWAHPTTGMGDKCAPSRTPDPLAVMTWAQEMVDLGWVVSATDYAGLGTPGIEYYLVGRSEAQDVLNSVRMAQRFPESHAGSEYGVFGHSQGGHSALWTGELSKSYAPELKLTGVAAAAPAAEFVALVDQQWNTMIGWVIGPQVMLSWPATYPDVSVDQVVSDAARGNWRNIAEKCNIEGGLAGLIEEELGNQPFAMNPAENPAWHRALIDQTPKPLPAELPTLVIQSVNDGVVFANTTALLQQKWCAAGSNISVDWLGPIRNIGAQTHQFTAVVAGPSVANWFQDRFAGRPAHSNCATTPAVAPYQSPTTGRSN